MSILSRYAKEKQDPCSYYISARIPERLGQAFAAYCADLNITVSQGIRLLIQNELKDQEAPASQEAPAAIQEASKEAAAAVVQSAVAMVQESSKDPIPAFVTPSDYYIQVNGRKLAPCPICRDWSSAANFKRNHTNKHGYSSQGTAAFYTTYLSTIEEMARERKK